jgi:putative ABC transport system permease protein
MPLLKLMWSNVAARRVRAGLTIAAIGLSVSLVVAVTSGYASVESAALAYLNRYLGSADAVVTRPQSILEGTVPESVMQELGRDVDVQRVTGRLDIAADVYDKDSQPLEKSTFHIVGIRLPDDTRIASLVIESGQWFDSNTSAADAAVVDQVAAQTLKVKVGDWFAIASESGKVRLHVVGIVHKPEIVAAAGKSIYLQLGTLQKAEQMDGSDPQLSQIAIDLKSNANADAFAARWDKRLDDINRHESKDAGHPMLPMTLRIVAQDRAMMDENMKAIHVLSYLGDAISLMAATFIIFSSLAMGVNERQRTLAMLRAIGATRAQVAGVVVMEGLFLSLVGVAAGVPLGILWTECLRFLFSDFFIAGVTVSVSGIALAVSGSLVAATAASLLPAWSASRLTPLEAMSPSAQAPPSGPPMRWAVLGIILILIDPMIFVLPLDRLAKWLNPSASPEAMATLMRFWAHYLFGAAAVFVGFFLLSPLLIWMIERAAAPLLARAMRVPAALLRHQLSQGLWRAAGAAAALMVGLSTLIVMTTQGTSMLDGWKLPDKFPDIFLVSLRLGGLNQDQWKKLEQTPGIRHFADGEPELVPVAVTISGLGSNPLALVGAVLAPTMNGTMFFGLPPKPAFQMIDLDFRDDNGNSIPRDQQDFYARRAEHDLELGRHVMVTEDYRRRNHVRYGDKIILYSSSQRYEYTICGIVWPPGLDVIISMFDLGRQFNQHTAGMIMGTLADAQHDFGADSVNLFAANLDTSEDKAKLLDDIRKRIGEQNIKAGDVRQIKAAVDASFRRLMALLTTVAFGAMAVASMGVTNTIMASVRSRRWQLGILRSIGLTSGALLRLVLAEALLLGIVALLLGIGCGVIFSLDARQMAGLMLGIYPPVVIPWGYVLIGAVSVMVVSAAAALWPAINASHAEPLALLAAGRAAT